MKRFLRFNIAVLMVLSCNSSLQAAPFDTGMTTLTQPNDAAFVGRIWGDEFFHWAETEDGYRFVQSGDGWYYYASLNQDGEYAPTAYKVGIDTPPISSYQLERTQSRIDEINHQIEEFNEQIELNKQWFSQKQLEAQAQPVALKVGIILIEFKDVKHFKNETNRPDGYLTADFDSLMFSSDYWVAPISNNIHPEGEAIFGSFRDYWYQMSRGKLIIEGHVVNPTDGNGIPEWLTAKDSINFYSTVDPEQWDTLADEAITEALIAGWIDTTDPGNENYYDNIVIIYAGNATKQGALMVVGGRGIGSNWIFLAERSGPNLFGGNLSEKSFTHIGVYAHEFGHNLGFNEEYGGLEPDPSDLKYFCLMARGIYNGPNRKSACPATLSPWYRIEYGWIEEPTLIPADTVNFLVEYDYNERKLYKINPVGLDEDMHYLFEVRKREGFDSYIPDQPGTYQNQSGTLLIWQHNIGGSIDRIRLKTADFNSTILTQLEDFFPSSNYQNYQCLNDTTYPMASLGFDYEELSTNLIQPAHFTLNGIQKLSNGDTQIGAIKLNHAIVKNKNESGFQNVSVPVGLQSYTLSSVFPTAISAYKFDPILGYVPVSELNSENGYWINFPSQPLNLILQGTVKDYFEIPVIGGFNLIGTISDKVAIPKICSDPPEILGPIYYFQPNKGYVLMTSQDSLYPGLAYWIYTYESGNLFFERFSEPCDLLKVTNTHEINFSDMDKFTIVDAEGNSQSLYVANIDIDTSLTNVKLDLPPFFPEINFDSRFVDNNFVKKVSSDSGNVDLNVLVHTNYFPITLSWEINPANGINYYFIDSSFGKVSNIESVNGKAIFNQLNNDRIQMWGSIEKDNSNLSIPSEYSLEQNYPNPFNPITKIKFAVPIQTELKLNLYNVLGEMVKTITKGLYEAGYYEVQLNVENLPSGIYIYSIESSNFVQSKKMILIK